MAYSFDWNAIFKALPGDSDAISAGADAIRDLKEAIQERIAHDHYMAIGGTQADHGEHQLIVFHEPESGYPTPGANKGALYTKNVSDKAELHWTDEDGHNLPLTSAGGLLAVPIGTKMYFYQNAAPTGWTYDSAVVDRVLSVKGGSNAYNANGGTEAGTWTQPGHTLTTDEIPSHTHSVPTASAVPTGGGAYSTPGDSATQANAAPVAEATGGGGSHNHGTTYRPYAAIGIIATKD